MRESPILPADVSPSARPLSSVGIDIGSATTQVMLSRLWLDNAGEFVTSRLEVVYREILYASDLQLTPFSEAREIDPSAIRSIVEKAYVEAGISPGGVETGALIVTGDASRTSNANAVAEAVAGMAGSFVCVAAGPNLEARLAALGSGAVEESARRGSSTMLHVDIGGATTKFAVLVGGRIVETAAVNVGARMLTFRDVASGARIVATTPAMRRLAASEGIDVTVGRELDSGTRSRVVRALARDLLGFIEGLPRPPDEVVDEPVTGPLLHPGPFEAISYSGGVAAYINGEESRSFGDLGPDLAAAIVEELKALRAEIVPLPRSIRATVLGASQFSTRVSGATTYRSSSVVLPIRGLRVVCMSVPPGGITASLAETLVRDAFAQVDLNPGEIPAVIAIHWDGEPTFSRLNALARGIDAAIPAAQGHPLAVAVVNGDLAGALGALLQEVRGTGSIVCIDEVALDEMDVVDIGAEISNPPVLPVTIRSIQASVPTSTIA